MKKVLLSICILLSFVFANKNSSFIVNPFADFSYDIGKTEYNYSDVYDYIYKYTGLNSSVGFNLFYKPLFLELQVSNLLQWAATGQDLFPIIGFGMIANIYNKGSFEARLSYTNNMNYKTDDSNYSAFTGSIGYSYFLNSISSGINIGIIHKQNAIILNTDNWWQNTNMFILSEFTYHTKYLYPYIIFGINYEKENEYFNLYPGFLSIGVQIQLKDFHSSGAQTKFMYFKTKEVSYGICKPNIYLYPESSSQVKVTLSTTRNNQITSSIPQYYNGWDVSIDPSGLIDNKYQYLFYEGNSSEHPNIKYGWSIAFSELWNFIPEKMSEYGFSQKEIKDFVDYWQVNLPKNEFYDIVPLINKAVDKKLALQIKPKPDKVLRVWFYVFPVNQKHEFIPPQIPKFNRNGFVVTEWGVLLNK
jgi:hypothetical protein